MAVLSLIGITGMYLRQVKQIGVLGLVGYLVLAAGYLLMMSIEVVGAVVLPALANSCTRLRQRRPRRGHRRPRDRRHRPDAAPSAQSRGVAYLAGGLLFGIALFRAGVLARWAAALLAVGTVATIAIPLLPQINERLFAVPTGIALIGLGYSLWREQRTAGVRSRLDVTSLPLDPADAK